MKRLLTIVAAIFTLALATTPATAAADWPEVRQGASGPTVQAVQHLLTAHGVATTADGQFGPATASSVRTFQSNAGLTVDGWIGAESWPVLVIEVQQGSTGAAVQAAQVMLRTHGHDIATDGQFGPQTDSAARAFQSSRGLYVDGRVGPNTWREMVGTSSGGTSPDGYSLPLPDGTVSRADYGAPHWNSTRAVDLIVPEGTPVLATQAATVEYYSSSSCGIGMKVKFSSTERFTYCHLSSRSVANYASVSAGQQVGLSGDTGNSGQPHLHIEPRHGSSNRCPQPYLVAVYDGHTPPPVRELPTSGCTS